MTDTERLRQVAIRKAGPGTIRMTLALGNLQLDDGTRIGSLSGLGNWATIQIEGLGRWEIDLLEAARNIMAGEGRPETGPLSHHPERTSDGT